MSDRLRRFAPLLVVMAGFVVVPLLAQRFPSADLRTEMLALRGTPQPLPRVEFEDDSGGKFTLDSFRGSFVLLNIWATWCAPCKAEMPSLNSLAFRFPAKDLAIVPVSIDVSGVIVVRRFYKEFALDKLPIYIDPSSKTMRALGIVGIPTTLLINRDGAEIARSLGPAQWDSPAIVEGLARISGR